MKRIVFTEIGFEQYVQWQGKDKAVLRKINNLIKSIDRDGEMNGIGKPERLKHRNGECSRRIDETNRLVYTVEGDVIQIISCKGHYERK